MIRFIQHTESGYPGRTIVNAQAADLTIAFATDFTTPGEQLTHKAAYGKYFKVPLRDPATCYLYNQEYRELLYILTAKNVRSINIAGNGIYSLPYYTQDTLNGFIYGFLKDIIEKNKLIRSIRSGGQTGVDQAGLIAGDRLGLETICLAPKNWLFRDINGKDIADEERFLARFGENYINNI